MNDGSVGLPSSSDDNSIQTRKLSSDQNLDMDSEFQSDLDAATTNAKSRKSALSNVSDKFFARYMAHLP